MISRRTLVFSAVPVLLAAHAVAHELEDERLLRISGLERKFGGRLGVAVLESGAKTLLAHRGNERFALCSTHKLLSVAFVLARVDRGQENLARKIAYARDALVAYSPATQDHVGEGMTLAALCEAAVTLSDNTAANLILGSFGGPPALTRYLRSLGDEVTRLDRREPELNAVPPADPRDTTTPIAMLETTQKLVLGSVLSASSRAQLIAWLVACKTGDKRLRAGLPKGWRVGDKTGTWSGPTNNATNDVAVIWPPQRAPILVTAYYADARATAEQREKILAEVGRIAAG
jgi:beta-lactamase class A